jgi:hypothetical protein
LSDRKTINIKSWTTYRRVFTKGKTPVEILESTCNDYKPEAVSVLSKVHTSMQFLKYYFAETESLWSQEPGTREFLKIVFDLAKIFDF